MTVSWNDAEGRARRTAVEARARLLASWRHGFEREQFLEVSTPTLLRAPGQEPYLRPFETRFDGQRLFLATSPEYAMKRLLVAGFERIYEFARSYRDGRDEHSPLHEPEFTLLEWYRAHEGLESLRTDLHRMLADGAHAVLGDFRVTRGNETVDLGQTPEWCSVPDAFREMGKVNLEPYLDGDDAAFLREVRDLDDGQGTERERADRGYYRVLLDRIEPRLGLGRPTLLHRYPARHAALAELCADDSRLAERFELYVLGIELANAFQELRDPDEQERRFLEEQARSTEMYGGEPRPICQEFLDALRAGMPPAAGIALGVDRVLMLLLGAARVSDVMAFPFLPRESQ